MRTTQRYVCIVLFRIAHDVDSYDAMNYYEILGIRENSTIQEIKKVYKSLVKKYHPGVSVDTSSQEPVVL